MKILVQFSGGKDSLASLIWAVKEFGTGKVVAVYCDTQWEHAYTYSHIDEVVKKLNVECINLKGNLGFIDLAKSKNRFPSTKARFCTTILKVQPFIDYILDVVDDDFIVIQGIRANESIDRSRMQSQCSFFKYYIEPYGYDKKGKPKKHSYRGKEVRQYIKKYCTDVLRPIFNWDANQVFSYIYENGLNPNQLYFRGASRVGCYPCVMSNHVEIKEMIRLEPEYFERIKKAEKEVGRTFFPPGYIPKHACQNKKYPTAEDVESYLTGKNATLQIFKHDTSCSSFYSLCERS